MSSVNVNIHNKLKHLEKENKILKKHMSFLIRENNNLRINESKYKNITLNVRKILKKDI